jgi:hypothetical protein
MWRAAPVSHSLRPVPSAHTPDTDLFMYITFHPSTRTLSVVDGGRVVADLSEVVIDKDGYSFKRASGDVFAAGKFSDSTQASVAKPVEQEKVGADIANYFGGGLEQ